MVQVDFRESNQSSTDSTSSPFYNLGMYVTFNDGLRTYFYTNDIRNAMSVMERSFTSLGNTYTNPAEYTSDGFRSAMQSYNNLVSCFGYGLRFDSHTRSVTMTRHVPTDCSGTRSECNQGIYDYEFPVDLFEVFTLTNLLYDQVRSRAQVYVELEQYLQHHMTSGQRSTGSSDSTTQWSNSSTQPSDSTGSTTGSSVHWSQPSTDSSSSTTQQTSSSTQQSSSSTDSSSSTTDSSTQQTTRPSCQSCQSHSSA